MGTIAVACRISHIATVAEIAAATKELLMEEFGADVTILEVLEGVNDIFIAMGPTDSGGCTKVFSTYAMFRGP